MKFIILFIFFMVIGLLGYNHYLDFLNPGLYITAEQARRGMVWFGISFILFIVCIGILFPNEEFV